MNLVLGVLTLGMWPLAKMLFGKPPRGIIRWAYLQARFDRLGQPSQAYLLRAFRKIGMSEREADVSADWLMRFGHTFLVDEVEAQRLEDLLADLGFTFSHVNIAELDNAMVWSEARKEYRNLDEYAECNHCGRQPTRIYGHWNNDDELEFRCSACDSLDVVDPKHLNEKELIRHVTELESLAAAGKGTRRGAAKAASIDAEFETTARRRKYG